MSETINIYECDGCGLCCSGRLIVEATALDVLREPRINEAYPITSKHVSLPVIEYTWILAPGKPCAFLNTANGCQIYQTRPNVCGAVIGVVIGMGLTLACIGVGTFLYRRAYLRVGVARQAPEAVEEFDDPYLERQ